MKKLIDNHFIHYLVLFAGLLTLSYIFYTFRYSQTYSLIIAFASSFFYLMWGIIHHALEKRLYKEIVFEYLLISIFIFLLFALVILF